MDHASSFAALMLLFGATTATAETAAPVNAAGAYQALSPGNQNVARALHEAQVPPGAGVASPKPLTVDQISAMKRGSSGWVQVHRDMQARGLIRDRSLASIVSRYNETARPAVKAARATPKTNGDGAARAWRDDAPVAAPAALAGNRVK